MNTTLTEPAAGPDDFQLPADGLFHLAPCGRFPHAQAGVVQVIDPAACAAITAAFDRDAQSPGFAGVLVDFDHFSHDPAKPSEAAGWITRLETRASGLYGQIRWSDKGLRAVLGGRYRFVSPVFDAVDLPVAPGATGPRHVRPSRLARLALTNDPNLKGLRPLTNRAADRTAAASDAPPPLPATPIHLPMNPTDLPPGPPAGGPDEALAARLESLKNRVTELEALNRSLLEAEFDSRFARRVKPAARARVRDQYLAGRSGALLIFESLEDAPAAPDTAALCDRRLARPPSTDTPAPRPRELRNREVDAFQQARHCDYDTAWNAVRALKPELFQDDLPSLQPL